MTDSVIDIAQYKYDQAEKDLHVKLVEYSERPEIQSQLAEAFYIWKDDPDFTDEEITEDNVDDLTFEKFFDWFLYDFKLLDSGERVIERFYDDEKGTLSDIEESIIRGWLESVYSFFEVEEVSPGKYCRISDLILNDEIKVYDSSSSNKLKPSDIIGARPLKAGKNTYFSGVISVYPAAFKKSITDYFESEFNLYRKSRGPERDISEYLREWGFHISNYAEEMANNPQLVTPEGEELVLASATYRIKDNSRALKKIGGIKPLKELSGPDDEIRIFSLENEEGTEILGSLEVADKTIKLESYSLNMLNKAKSMIEKELGDHIEFLEDRTKGLDSYIRKEKQEKIKLNKLPPGVKSLKELEKELDDYYSGWIDQPLQALNGKTPRQAAKTSEGRKDLHLVLNELENIYKHAKMSGEPYFDLNKIRKKLKLK
jgi:hypothetical protein